ncbi:MAG: ABC transporter permease [Gammaproteobacteria bacterium]|nr:ABC transporter permease [Gammaproteobacteria bacterium]MCP5201971.1 ABC transporter permease [Gammaproteobacteria bacterium]
MHELGPAITQALHLLLSGDTVLWSIIGVSFSVSLRAIAIATPLALAAAFVLAYLRFPGRRILVTTVNTLMAVPAVVVGLTCYLVLSSNGPAGGLHLLFTQWAMIIGQIVLCLPLLVAMAHSALQSGDQRAWETALTLGASRLRAMRTVMYEVRFGLLAAIIAAFGRIIAEVGCSMMVGGNILHHTRNIPTAIALETAKGEFAQGIALGGVLLAFALLLNLALGYAQGSGRVIP